MLIKHAEADKEKKRELIDAKNQAESLIYSTEKTINEDKDNKISQETKDKLNEAIKAVKTSHRR